MKGMLGFILTIFLYGCGADSSNDEIQGDSELIGRWLESSPCLLVNVEWLPGIHLDYVTDELVFTKSHVTRHIRNFTDQECTVEGEFSAITVDDYKIGISIMSGSGTLVNRIEFKNQKQFKLNNTTKIEELLNEGDSSIGQIYKVIDDALYWGHSDLEDEVPTELDFNRNYVRGD